MTAPDRPTIRPATPPRAAAGPRRAVGPRLLAVGGGLLGLAALAGCAPTAAAPDPSSSTAPTASGSSASPSASASASSAASADLKDGTYTATGDYQSPGGAASIEVTVTLASGSITAVEVVPKAQDATARQYETQFASGIGAVVVGKPIEGLQVGSVSGSSLTGAGFEQALATIRAEAAA